MNQEIELSDAQANAVNYQNGALLVMASAGSGKTRILTERIKKLLPITKRKILAITFTNKAGEEMRERLGQTEEIKNRIYIGTFHSFCQNILENHGKHIGLNTMPHIFEDESDRLELIEQAIEASPIYYEKYIALDSKKKRTFRYKVLDFISDVKRNLLNDESLIDNINDEDIILIYREYQDILSSQNAIDFDDLILLAYNLLSENKKIAGLYRRTYKYICIDEAQDLNYAQYQLLKSLVGDENKNVMMVGDPNQSIFAFNGSSSDYMKKYFIQDFTPKIIKLKENYRSSKAVLKAAEKIIPNANEITNSVKEGVFEIYSAKNEEKEAEWIWNKINELIKQKKHPDIEGEIQFEKIAVLARNKYVFNLLEEIFKTHQTPYYFKSTPGALKFVSQGMKIFDLALRVKLNRHDIIHRTKLKTLLQLSNDSIKNESLESIEKKINNGVHGKIIELVICLNEDGSNLKPKLNSLNEFIKNDQSLNDDNERRMIINDIEEVLKHWYNYAKKTDRKSLHQFKNSMALGKTHSSVQKKGITLSTVHTMKGQEYEIVFLMGMDDETFPDYRAVRKGGVELTQEKNNAYVAFTRAKRFLYVTYPKVRLMPWGDTKARKISRFLAPLL